MVTRPGAGPWVRRLVDMHGWIVRCILIRPPWMSAPPPFSGNCVYGKDPMDKDRPASRMRLKEKRIRSILGTTGWEYRESHVPGVLGMSAKNY